MQLPISDQQQPWPYLSPFLRYSYLAFKNHTFFLLHLYSTANPKMFPLHWIAEILHAPWHRAN